MQGFTLPPIIRGVVNCLFLVSFMLLGVDAQAALNDTSRPQLKAAGQWSYTGSLTATRSHHTATLLPSGNVLVVGGYNYSNDYLSSAELYNPSTGSWISTGSMTTRRQHHTSTLLPNGKVVVVGGRYGNITIVNSPEVYDPSTSSWSNTGSMTTARMRHTATLLSNGKVLVVGGNNNLYLGSAEVYDPSTGSWSSTGSLTTERYGHTATLLPNGKVLVAGGVNGNGVLSSAEVYDPSTGSWSSTDSLTTGRYLHTATLLSNGKVLVAGGEVSSYLSSAEVYDSSTGSWSSTGSMTTGRRSHTATLLSNGKVLVAGGMGSSGYLSSVEVYDPSTSNWSSTGSLTTERILYTATLLSTGKVLVAGGEGRVSYNGIGILSSAELYEPAVVPTVITNAPSVITATSARLSGTVNTNGGITNASFDWGKTTTYGANITAIPATIAANAGPTNVYADLTGLTCNTTYNYRAKADNSAGSREGTNQTFKTTDACFRDLTITNVKLTPAAPMAGIAFNAVITIKNQGTIPNTISKLKLWTNQPTVPTCASNANKTVNVTALAPGASTTITTAFTSNTVGKNTFRAFVDGTCVVAETDETNNQRAVVYRLTKSLPDLVITDVTLTPSTPATNGMFTAMVTVKNQGTATIGGGFLDLWTNSTTAVTCGTNGDAWADVGTIAAGASKAVTVSDIPAGIAGAKTLRAFVDSWCEAAETNETNNQLTKAYSVQ